MDQDQYQSTNKLPENPYPERSHLLLEDKLVIPASDYQALVGNAGWYVASAFVPFSRLLQLGNRIKGFPPKTLEAKVWKHEIISGGGEIRDYYRPLPFTKFSSYVTPTMSEHCFHDVESVYIIADDLSEIWLSIVHYRFGQPSRDQAFSYKIYNTAYDFIDTL